MKRYFGVFVAALFALLVGTPAVAAGLDVERAARALPSDVFKDVSRIPATPHFLLGIEQKTDEWEQYLEVRKMLRSRNLPFMARDTGIIDKSQSDYVVRGNTELVETLSLGKKNVRIVYTHHHFTKGRYVFLATVGERNLAEFSPAFKKYEAQWLDGKLTDEQWGTIQAVLGWAQFEAVRASVHASVKGAIAKNVADYREMNLTEAVVAARSAILNDPEYGRKLEQAVPGAPGLKVRDVMVVPLTRPEDFTPDLLFVGPGQFIGGFANYKTPGTERIVFIDLRALMWEHVIGSPRILAHEFVHTNPYLQGTPLSFYYDLEMYADLTTGLEEGFMTYLFHPYAAVIRDLGRVYFGYDFELARERVFKGYFGISDVNEQEFRKHVAMTREIREAFSRYIKDPKEGLMVRFYTDPYFWITINTKFCDTAAAVRLTFAFWYKQAGIFNPDQRDASGKAVPPAIQTETWLAQEEEAGRIRRLAEIAMQNTGKESDFAKTLPKIAAPEGMKCPVDSRVFLMDDKDQKRFVSAVESLVRRADAGEEEARYLLMRIFGGTRGGLNPLHRR